VNVRKVAWNILTAAIVWEILQLIMGVTIGVYIAGKWMGVW
jgi:uncharacterized protein YneF (UPF0154 family)